MANGFEYTPEITEDYLQSVLRPNREATAQNVGRARGEALRRGLEGDPYEALRVGAAQRTGALGEQDTRANLAFGVAGMRRDERVGEEKFTRESEWTSGESEKGRSFQERMAERQHQYAQEMAKLQSDLARRKDPYSWNKAITDIGQNALSSAAGWGMGKMGF